ncbi:5363_t:CDS:1, partial [Scutellospora calospora]
YTNDISYIDTYFATKKKDFDINNLESSSSNLIRSRLIHVHQSIAKYSEDISKTCSSLSIALENSEIVYQNSLLNDNTNLLKHKRSDEFNELVINSYEMGNIESINVDNIEDKPKTNENNFFKSNQELKKLAKINKSQKNLI